MDTQFSSSSSEIQAQTARNLECETRPLEVQRQRIQLIPTNAIDQESIQIDHSQINVERRQNQHFFAINFEEMNHIQRISMNEHSQQSFTQLLSFTPIVFNFPTDSEMNNFQRFQEMYVELQQFLNGAMQLARTTLNPQVSRPKLTKCKKLRSGKHECSICFEKIKKNNKIPVIQCKHKFHKKCLQKWVEQKPNCPLCRSSIV